MAFLPSSCARPPAKPSATPPTRPLSKPEAARGEATLPAVPPESPGEPAPRKAPVAMKPAAVTEPAGAAKPKATLAASLGGPDRRLALRPFDAIPAADFELGELVGGETEPSLSAALGALGLSLVSGELPLDLFAEGAAAAARVRYGETDFEGIGSVRFSSPSSEFPGVVSVGMRALAERTASGADSSGEAPRSALGLAILSRGESGEWTIEHFELDVASLGIDASRPEPWDPYGTP